MKNIKHQMLVVIIVVVMFYLLSSAHKVDIKQTITNIVTQEILVPNFREQQETIHREYLKQGSEKVKVDIKKVVKSGNLYEVSLSREDDTERTPPFLEFVVSWEQGRDGDITFLQLRVIE